jgi:chemotaxis-related protein WspD
MIDSILTQSGSSTQTATAPNTVGDCWNRIGTSGDGSCPELQTHIHCRNCPVFASAARTFFDRSAPQGYLAEWTQWLAGSLATGSKESDEHGIRGDQDSERDLISVLIFRLGQESLAFRTQTIAEVTLPRPVHRIPHRSNEILMGLVNLRGQLQLFVSLHGLLGVDPHHGPPAYPLMSNPVLARAADVKAATDTGSGMAQGSRLVVLRDRDRSETWIFAAEEVLGVHRLARTQLRSVSSSLANPEVSFSQALLSWKGRSVAFLDEQRVFAALRSIGQ